jgi:hypothetical protein
VSVTFDEKPAKPPVGEEAVALVGIPSWGAYAAGAKDGTPAGPSVDRERHPALRWPQSVTTFDQMSADTQLSGLYRATTLPPRRYVWGIDPNGARQEVVDDVRREFNLELIDDAWQAFQTGQSAPIPRARNRFTLDRHLVDVFKACRFGHSYFEKVGYQQDGPDSHWYLVKLGPISPWTIGQIWVAQNGDLISIKQNAGLFSKPLEAWRLVAYVLDGDTGDWTGRSMYRSCYREWLAKDSLLKIDVTNHEKAGGILLTEAPKDATAAQIKALGDLAASARVGGGGAIPNGTTPVFLRGTGSDVIASINRHDEAMAREFLAMFMALGTSSSGGNRALAGSFIDWFALSQEALAIWARDTFNENVIEDYIDWNYGPDEEFVPRLAFRRPENANPLDQLAQQVNQAPGTPGAVGVKAEDGTVVPVAAVRFKGNGWGLADTIVVADDDRELINQAHADYDRQTKTPNGRVTFDLGRASPAAAATPPAVPVPNRPLRREPTDVEVQAAVNFAQLDANWQQHATSLLEQWQAIRAKQIAELEQLISTGDGDLEALAQIQATAQGGDLIAAQLRTMAGVGAQEALGEAARQGVATTAPDLAAVESQLAARAAALEQLLARSLSEAAARRAVALSGGALTSSQVAAETRAYLEGLTDTYLTDQFGGALSAAQNAGRMAAMDANGATRMYASELLDTNTCDACEAVDGTEYETADQAAADYPAGGFKDCAGGPRCRGTVVAVYGEAPPSSEGGA